MSVQYYRSDTYHPPTLLRRVNNVDEAFVGGVWRPTGKIIDWEFGHNDFVDVVTEDQARAFAPAAFRA